MLSNLRPLYSSGVAENVNWRLPVSFLPLSLLFCFFTFTLMSSPTFNLSSTLFPLAFLFSPLSPLTSFLFSLLNWGPKIFRKHGEMKEHVGEC